MLGKVKALLWLQEEVLQMVQMSLDNEGSFCVPTVTATATVPWTSFCSLDMQQINCVVYSISSF
jgi:hypothetical protein